MLKAGPRQAEFEPIQAKTYKFSDVHGVDEAKGVGNSCHPCDNLLNPAASLGTPRHCGIPQGPFGVRHAGREVA